MTGEVLGVAVCHCSLFTMRIRSIIILYFYVKHNSLEYTTYGQRKNDIASKRLPASLEG